MLVGINEGVSIQFYEIARFTKAEVESFRDNPEEYLLREDDIVLAGTGTIGKVVHLCGYFQKDANAEKVESEYVFENGSTSDDK